MDKDFSLAPIAFFAYKRPFHTFQSLSSLSKNKEAKESDLIVYIDGPINLKELHLVDAYSVEPYKNNSEMSFQDYISKYSKITGEFSEAGFTNYYDRVYESVKERFKKYSHVKLNRMPSSKWFAENKNLKLEGQVFFLYKCHSILHFCLC